jgi:hypothetical protein
MKHRQGRLLKPHIYRACGDWFIDHGDNCSGPYSWWQLQNAHGWIKAEQRRHIAAMRESQRYRSKYG